MSSLALSNSLTDLAFRIRAEHEAVASAMKRGLKHAMAAGELRIEAKPQVKHGGWLPWLNIKEHCGIPERTAGAGVVGAGYHGGAAPGLCGVGDGKTNSTLGGFILRS